MIDNKNNGTLERMKSLMKYGLQTESKLPYSSIEYQKVGADGNVYGIIREGQKYYIKIASNKKDLLKEDFNYIGGFRNRKENEYSSFANAQKNFDLKMMAIKESAGKKDYKIESWDLDKKERVVVEASDKMKKEISREMQIMENASKIYNRQGLTLEDCKGGDPFCTKAGKEYQANPNMKNAKPEYAKGNVEDAVDHEKVNLKDTDLQESEQVLGWNRKNKDYMDKSHGTEIGDSAPFDDATAHNIDDAPNPVSKTGEMRNGVVENHGTPMHPTQDQNKPAPGTGEGPSDDNNKPFDAEKGRDIKEAVEDFDDADVEGAPEGEEPMPEDGMGEEPMPEDGMEDDFGADDMGDEEDFDDEEEDDDPYAEDLEDRMDALEDLIGAIADKLGVDVPPVDEENYEDDDLFGDEDEDEENEYELELGDDDEEPMDDEFEGDEDFGDEEGEDEVYESRAFRKAMMNEAGITPFKDAGRVPQGNMNKLDDFGKHPAYQKQVMSLPPKDFQEFPGYYDMNDDSVRNDTPYGENIGDGAPFEIDPESIDNAIAEAYRRLKKKV